jgi:hypothetical protein
MQESSDCVCLVRFRDGGCSSVELLARSGRRTWLAQITAHHVPVRRSRRVVTDCAVMIPGTKARHVLAHPTPRVGTPRSALRALAQERAPGHGARSCSGRGARSVAPAPAAPLAEDHRTERAPLSGARGERSTGPGTDMAFPVAKRIVSAVPSGISIGYGPKAGYSLGEFLRRVPLFEGFSSGAPKAGTF